MKMVVYMAVEVIRAMKPWAGANENTARKPFRPVVAVGSTAIRRGVIVTVGAVGGTSNVDADADLLRSYFGRSRCEANPATVTSARYLSLIIYSPQYCARPS